MDTDNEQQELTLESLDIISGVNEIIRNEIAPDIYNRVDECGVRSVTLKISFKPDEDGVIATQTAIKTSLPAVKTVVEASLGNRHGEVVLQIPKQQELPGLSGGGQITVDKAKEVLAGLAKGD